MRFAKCLKAVMLTLLLALALPCAAWAAGSIQLDKEVSLDIVYKTDTAPLSKATFSIYLVATVDEYGEFTPTDAFAPYYVNISGKDDEAWRAQASTLEGYVLLDKIAPTDTGKTDVNGKLHLPTGDKKLVPGLYLVLGDRLKQDGWRYDAAPAFVTLPTTDTTTNTWQYNVVAAPKHEASQAPSDSGSTDNNSTKRKVLKIWQDTGHENARPQLITVQLLRDGEIYSTVTLSAKNNWRYTWDNLSDESKWTLVEKATPGYTGTVTKNGITFTVTNTYTTNNPDNPNKPDKPDKLGGPDGPDNPDNPDNPNNPNNPDDPDKPDKPGTPGDNGTTGGNTPGGTPDNQPDAPKLPQTGQLWWPVPIMLFAGLLLVLMGLMQRRGVHNEK